MGFNPSPAPDAEAQKKPNAFTLGFMFHSSILAYFHSLWPASSTFCISSQKIFQRPFPPYAGFQPIISMRHPATKKAQRFHAGLHVSFFNTGIFSQPVAGLKHFLHLSAKNPSPIMAAACWLLTHQPHRRSATQKPNALTPGSCFTLQSRSTS